MKRADFRRVFSAAELATLDHVYSVVQNSSLFFLGGSARSEYPEKTLYYRNISVFKLNYSFCIRLDSRKIFLCKVRLNKRAVIRKGGTQNVI